MDEAEVAKQKYNNVLVGSLNAPNQTFLIDCHPLGSGSNVYSNIILHTVDDILRQHVFGWKDIKGFIPFFDAFHLRCVLTT